MPNCFTLISPAASVPGLSVSLSFQEAGPLIRKRRDQNRSIRSQPLRVVSELPANISPVTAETLPAAPAPTPAEASLLGPPDLPDLTLSPTPLSRSPLSAVYLGWDRLHRCDVIVKVQRVTNDPVAMERFRREAAVMARLRHPSIVSLYRFYEGDPASLVMEYVRGQTLAALVKADGWLPTARVAAIIDSIAAGLDSAHAENIIHRDVKPANILLPRRGPARLTDFGVAHIDDDAPLTVMGDMLGTIEYASPEQVRGQETPDARSDVYSLAAVTYFALTGTPPFRAADESTQAQLSVMHRQVFADPPPLRFHREDISPAVEAVVLRGLAKTPDERFQTAGHFAAALHAAAEAEAGTPEENALAAASRRAGAVAGVLAAAAVMLLGGGMWWKMNHAVLPAPLPVRVAARTQPPPSVHPHPLVVPQYHPAPTHHPVKHRRIPAPAVVIALPHAKPRLAAPPPAEPLHVKVIPSASHIAARPPQTVKRVSVAVRPAVPARISHHAIRFARAPKPALAVRPAHPVHLAAVHPSPAHAATPPRHIAAPAHTPVFVTPTLKAVAEPPPPHLRNP